MWVRDYAPYFIAGQQLAIIDFQYPETNRDMEDEFPMALASAYGFRYDHSQLTLEGGNLISNGHGVCISSTKVSQQNAPRGYNEQRIGELLHQHFHFERWIRLNPLDGEPTGHADMFVALCAPNKCIVGLYKGEDDPVNAKILDENAAILKGEDSGLKGEDGRPAPIDVIRIPMPSHADGNWRSYTNVIYANGTLLVPQYPQTCPDLDKVAIETFREAMPDWKIVGIDCEKLIAKRGALHCISRQMPAMPSGKEPRAEGETPR
jgi:agmatine/peptidylarginine deiminase